MAQDYAIDIWKVPFTVNGRTLIKEVEVGIREEGNRYRLKFAYDAATLEQVKKLQGATYKADEDKTWLIDKHSERNAFALYILRNNQIPGITDICFDKPDILRDYQVEGYNFLLNRYWAMLAFEMRLGKTLTTIRAIEYLWKNEQMVNWWLVAPYGAQQEWRRQLQHWNTFVDFTLVTTYESLAKYVEAIKNNQCDIPQGVIFDESIKLKNPTAQRSKAVYTLCSRIREKSGRIYMLSGAPAPKDPTDWWHQLECLRPGFIAEPDIHAFRRRYAIIENISGPFGTFPKVIGWNERECRSLGQRLAPFVLVKHIKDCASLPDRVYEYIHCEPDREIKTVCNALIETAPSALHALEWSRELSDGFKYEEDKQYRWIGSPKMQVVVDLLSFYSRDNEGPGRLIIYSSFNATIQEIKKIVEANGYKTIVIDGRQAWSSEDIKRFQSNNDEESQICIVANPACVHGLTLSASPAIVYYSNNFSVDARIQSERRAEEVGSTRGTRIIDLVHLPIDEKIAEMLKKKIAIQSITLEEIKKWAMTTVS